MLDGLAEAIEQLDVAVDRDELARAIALRDRLDAKIAEAVAAYDSAALWECDGSTSMTAWLRSEAGMAGRDAARAARVAKHVARLPETAAAWRDGHLSSGQVDTIAGRLSDATISRFAEQEAELLPVLAPLGVNDLARAMRQWQAHALAEVEPDHDEGEPKRELHVSPVGDRWQVDANLDAEGGQVVATAIRLATTRDLPDEPMRTPAQRRGDALVAVCRYFLDNQQSHRGGRHRPHLNVVVDLTALEQTRGGTAIDGPSLDGPTVSRLLCDSVVHRVLTEGRSAVLDYGSSTRTIPTPLWNALVIRDEHCRFPGCDRPSKWSEGHHVKHVEHGGPTNLDNLVLLCTRHHHRLHDKRWHAKLLPDATFEVTLPNGTTRTTRPPGTLDTLEFR
ncbi:MAG TPA: DUF222 domain-containing protein [Acidimicrobiales bacterium]